MGMSDVNVGITLEDPDDEWIYLQNWNTRQGCPQQAVGKRVEVVMEHGGASIASPAEAFRRWSLVEKFRVIGDVQPESKLYAPENAKKYNHYFVRVPWSYIDIYRLLELFKVTDNAIGHAVKKLLVPGLRGSKPTKQDIIEARDTLNRRIEMWDEDESVKDDML